MPEHRSAVPSTGKVPCQIGDYRFVLGAIEYDDKPQVEGLFRRVFGEAVADGWYEWKYRSLHGCAVGLWNESGELLAHYAGFPRMLLSRGQMVPTVQIGDVMVAPEVRGLLTKRGPFFQVCSLFFSANVGKERQFALAFGFPNERAIRLGIKLGLYHDAGLIHQLAWPATPASLPFGWGWRPLAADKDVLQVADVAWRKMRRDFSGYTLGIRNEEFLQARFIQRPERIYRFFCVYRKFSRRTAAIVVLRLAQNQAELVDFIGEHDALTPAVRGARNEAAQVGATTLTAWGSPAVAAALKNSSAEVTDTAAHLAIAVASCISGEELNDTSWWWMGGDTDFR